MSILRELQTKVKTELERWDPFRATIELISIQAAIADLTDCQQTIFYRLWLFERVEAAMPARLAHGDSRIYQPDKVNNHRTPLPREKGPIKYGGLTRLYDARWKRVPDEQRPRSERIRQGGK